MDLKQALVSINCSIHKGEGDDRSEGTQLFKTNIVSKDVSKDQNDVYLDESDMIGRTAQQAEVTAPEVHGPLPGSIRHPFPTHCTAFTWCL